MDPCRGPIYFPASPQNSLESACKDSDHRSETLNKCEEATPIKTGNRVFDISQGLGRESGMTWKTEGIGMHGWSEPRKMLLPLQATRKQPGAAEVWTCTHDVCQNPASHRHTKAALQLQTCLRGVARSSATGSPEANLHYLYTDCCYPGQITTRCFP